MATPYIQIEKLTKSYGDRLLFGDVTFGINEGDKVGLIARNGTGKSTLLRLIAGEESADSGTITPRNGLRMAYLPQTPSFGDCNDLPSLIESRIPADAELADTMRTRLERMLTQLGVNISDRPLSLMSGGERKRIAIALTLMDEPQLLILDEPTNHLDIDSIEWLENYLCRARVAILLVTHDRYFLDRICSRIIEIDHCEVYAYDGNYDYYLRKRKERIDALTGELAKVKNTLRREQEWMSRQPQARGGKAKYRIDAFYELKERSRADYSQRDVKLDVRSSYIGSKIFEAVSVSKRYGDKTVLDDFSYNFARHEKVGIIGENGVGKSTFIKMLQGLVQPDFGHFDVGETVRFGYYSQDGINFDESKRVIDAITEIAEDVVVNDSVHYSPMQFLQRFLFTPVDQLKYISKLSGGERCRLHLASVLMRSPNFLILDEPTNDLDIVTLALLEEYLRDFKGCVIVVSHDRFFLDSIVDHLFVFAGNGIVKDFPGTYTEYKKWLNEQAQVQVAAAAPVKESKDTRQRSERPRKLSFKERREMETLEVEIEALTAEKSRLEAIFNGESEGDITEASTRYQALTDELDAKEMRWLELSEI